jgi:hypothetical protein
MTVNPVFRPFLKEYINNTRYSCIVQASRSIQDFDTINSFRIKLAYEVKVSLFSIDADNYIRTAAD